MNCNSSDKSIEKSEPLYAVTFEDNSVFFGGDFKFPRWNKCPGMRIKSLELYLPEGKDKIVLRGYGSYNFFIGIGKALGSSRVLAGHMYGLGCNGGVVTSYRITLISSNGDKYRTGDITVRKFPLGSEGVGKTSTSGWKTGIIG